jgi:hypothetical protein
MSINARPFAPTAACIALFGLVIPACHLSQDSKTFRFDETVERVDVDVDAGLINLRPTEGAGARVDAQLEWSGGESPDFDVWVADGTLFVRGECSSVISCNTDFTLTVPANAELDVDLSAGSVEVRDMSGPLFVELSAGEVQGWGLKGDVLHAEVTTGSIDLSFSEGATTVYADVTTGEVELAVPDRLYQVEAGVTTGSVDVDVATSPNADAFIAAKVVTGEVHVRPAH